LKTVEFSEDQDAEASLRRLIYTLRHRLDNAATLLNQLHQRAEYDREGKAQQMVMDVFRELRRLEREASEIVEPVDERHARALLVEENDNERELLAGYLRTRGFETTIAHDGQDALDYLSLHALPDIVLLDMQMPRCNGRCFVKRVRADEDLRSLKVFAVSNVDPNSLGISVGPEGIDRWIRKPVNPERLVDEIAGEIGRQVVAV
jgi:CheY-like chemotaxis protein